MKNIKIQFWRKIFFFTKNIQWQKSCRIKFPIKWDNFFWNRPSIFRENRVLLSKWTEKSTFWKKMKKKKWKNAGFRHRLTFLTFGKKIMLFYIISKLFDLNTIAFWARLENWKCHFLTFGTFFTFFQWENALFDVNALWNSCKFSIFEVRISKFV